MKYCKKDKPILLGIVIVLLISLCIFILIERTHREPEHIYAEAKIVSYTDTDELIARADVIAVCEKISEDNNIVERNEQEDIIAVYTLSTLEVMSVEKGELENGEQLVVMENEGYVEAENAVYHIAGYERMQVGKKYLLLLRKSETDPWYITLGVNYGKIPLDENENILMKGASADQVKEVKSYQNEIKESLAKES